MMKKIIPIIIIFLFCSGVLVYPDIKFSGAVRNDAFLTRINDDMEFNDVLENKLIVIGKSEEWKFYADARIYVFLGEYAEELDYYELKLMRSFIRYYSEIGDFTLGKTYINLGNIGLFNPFDTDKQVNTSDLAYDKEGFLALEYDFPLGDISGGRVYAGTDNVIERSIGGSEPSHPRYAGGFSLYTNAAGFDFGIAANHRDSGMNIAGGYFKGDLVIGIHGAYGCHFNDSFKKPFSEANFGIDYSFFEGHLILMAMFYFNQNGAGEAADTVFEYLDTHDDTFFYSKYYLYGSVKYVFDEFLSAEAGCFANLIDGSTVIIPSITWVISNGLTMTLQCSVLTGKDADEFSRDIYGDFSILLRLEARF